MFILHCVWFLIDYLYCYNYNLSVISIFLVFWRPSGFYLALKIVWHKFTKEMKFCAIIVLILCILNCQRLVAKYITASLEPLPFYRLDVPHIKRTFVDKCGFDCLESNFCVSLNLAGFADSAGKLWCELLSSHLYNNTEKLIADNHSHHLMLKVEN